MTDRLLPGPPHADYLHFTHALADGKIHAFLQWWWDEDEGHPFVRCESCGALLFPDELRMGRQPDSPRCDAS